jgi:hypothetical protein
MINIFIAATPLILLAIEKNIIECKLDALELWNFGTLFEYERISLF